MIFSDIWRKYHETIITYYIILYHIILYHIYHIILCNTVTAIYPDVHLCANDNHLSHKPNNKSRPLIKYGR